MTEFKTLEELATNLISKKSKSSLIYAFNGSGKTRLSWLLRKNWTAMSVGKFRIWG